jgi:threonine synthase
VPAEALSCRACQRDYPLEAMAVCPDCHEHLMPRYDLERLRRDLTREAIAAGPPSLWRYAPLLPVTAPAEPALAPGLTPLVPAPRLAKALGAREVYLKLDTANPTHSFKDRVAAVAAAKAREFGFEVLACASTGNLANAVAARAAAEGLAAAVFCPADLEPEKFITTAVCGATLYAVDGTYDDCSRLAHTLSSQLPWAFVNVNLRPYYAEGSKTLAYEVAEQLGWTFPDVVVSSIASGAMFTKVGQGFGELAALGLVDGQPPRLYGGQAAGCAPVAQAFAANRPVEAVRPQTLALSLAIGNPGSGNLAVAAARQADGAIYAVPEEAIGANMAMLAELTGVFGETAAGVVVGAARIAAAEGRIGPRDRVVLLVTGDGLKTPGPVTDRLKPFHIAATPEAVLATIGERETS